MAKAPKLYTRLSRNMASVGTYQSLWLGADHILIVTSTGYTESYARLQLRDIKGFFITTSERRLAWGVTWGCFSAVFLLAVIVNSGGPDLPYFSGGGLLFFGALLLWNHLLGPSCHAFVVTGVQTAKLPAMVREKKALRLLGRLQPLIEAAQADLVVAPSVSPVLPPMPPAAVDVSTSLAPSPVPPADVVAAPLASPLPSPPVPSELPPPVSGTPPPTLPPP